MNSSYDYRHSEQSVVETTEHDVQPYTALGSVQDPGLILDDAQRSPSFSRYPVSLQQPLQNDEVDAVGEDYSLPSDQKIRVEIRERRPRFAALPYSTSRSGLVYDSSMRFHVDQTEANDDAHPERPGRILQIFDEFVDNDLVPRPLSGEESEYHLLRIPTREATKEELCYVHTREHVDYVQSAEAATLDEIRRRTLISEGQSSIYWHNLTYLCAKLAAGGAIEATEAVLRGRVKNAVAIIRPPGHHAEHNEPSGFCFFNNVSIAVKAAQKKLPSLSRKVLILDWDVHHGNGIQHAFYDDPNVLYISIHVFRGGTFYPHNPDANHVFCGAGPGEGRNVNIPWSDQGMTDADYMLAFQQVVMPIAVEFDPDLVMISAGFDAADGDPLGGCYVSPACYAHMTHMLMQLAEGKVVACLEGGYNLQSIAKSALAMTRTLMGEAPERMGNMTPSKSAVAVVQQVIRTQAAFWKCMYPKKVNIQLQSDSTSERLHDVIRERQSKVLWDNHQMVSLFIRRNGISKSFKDQVLATQNFQEHRPLLLIFHDPPQVTDVSARAESNLLELHNTLLTDSLRHYIDWAVEHDFAVIDVNVPKYITKERDDGAAVSSHAMGLDSDDERSSMCKAVAHYIWDNYLEVGKSSHKFFMGVGESTLGLIDLLRSPDTGCLDQVAMTISFVAEQTILGVQHPDDESFAKTYNDNSLVFVSNTHTVFQQMKKLKKRHGKVKKSRFSNLQEMLDAHRDYVFEQLLEKTAAWRSLQQPQTSSAEAASTGTDDEAQDMDVDAGVETPRHLTPARGFFPTSSPGLAVRS